MFIRPVLLIAGAGLAVAQSISSQCTSTLLAVASSPQATCLDLTLLAPLAVSNTSVVPTINSWLTGMCSRGPCSNATLQAVVANITTGCSSDLASYGLSTNDTAGLTTTIQAAYPAVRQIACLQDTSSNTLCVTEVLNGIQSATTTLSINNIIGLVSGSQPETVNIPQNVTCSNCSKAAYNIAAQNALLTASDRTSVQSECGSSFTDGQTPQGIRQSASNTTSSSTGGAASLSVNGLNVGLATLFAVSSAFVYFA